MRRFATIALALALAAAVGGPVVAAPRSAGARSSTPIDAQFIRGMVVHHSVAIEMAEVELRRGRDPRVKGLAVTIIAKQRREIAQLTARAQRVYGFTPSRTMTGPEGILMGMPLPMRMNQMPVELAAEKSVDRAFLRMMIPHHASAIVMAENERKFGDDPMLRAMSVTIVQDQAEEIGVMQQLLSTM